MAMILTSHIHRPNADNRLTPFIAPAGSPAQADMLSYPTTRSEGTMEYNLPLNGSIDLDALDDYLVSDHAPDYSMGLSDLDGFLTGVVVGPELIPPSEWLPVIWGGVEPEFETENEMHTVLGTIMGRYNEIAACFNSDPEEFDPIFWEGPGGEVIASDWAGGFLDAVALRPQAWAPLIDDDGVGVLMTPLFMLNGGHRDRRECSR
jgi:yecA family protein